VGVSTDSLKTQHKFTAKHNIGFPLIGDNGALKKIYGKGRTTYIIDQQGVIRFIYQGVPVNTELLQELENLAPDKF
jgi:peroxiredoxin Q/BCP